MTSAVHRSMDIPSPLSHLYREPTRVQSPFLHPIWDKCSMYCRQLQVCNLFGVGTNTRFQNLFQQLCCNHTGAKFLISRYLIIKKKQYQQGSLQHQQGPIEHAFHQSHVFCKMEFLWIPPHKAQKTTSTKWQPFKFLSTTTSTKWKPGALGLFSS